MASPRILCLAFSLLLMSGVDFGPARAAGTHKKRSIQYTFRGTSPTQYWTSAPSTSLAGGQLLPWTGGLGAFSAPLDSPFLPRMTSPVVAPSPEVPGLQPMPVTYLHLPAMMAAQRGMTPAAIGASPMPTICIHTHPVAPAPATDLAVGDLLVPGGGDTQTQTLRMLLGQLLTARTAAAGGTQRPAALDLSLLSELGLGLLNPALFRPGAAALPPPGMLETRLNTMAAAERNSVTERPASADSNPDSEVFTDDVFPRSAPSAPASGWPGKSERLSRLLSAGGDEWSNVIWTKRQKRSLPRAGRSESKHQSALSALLGKIIRRIGFEKYGESLKVILQDLQPLKEAMRATQSDLNKVQSTYHKFENDLNHLLEQTRGAQQILLFILSNLFQTNILTRRKLEECVTSNQVLTAQLRFPSRDSELTTLLRQLERKMGQFDALVLSLLKKKSALEVERQRMRQSCNIRIKSGAETDPFSLSTLLSLMTGLGEPSGAQRDINVLLKRLFPDLYPEAPPLPPRTAAFKLPDAGTGGAGSGWLQVLVPMLNVRPRVRQFRVPVPLPPQHVGVPPSFSRQFRLRRPTSPRTSPLTHEAAPPLNQSPDSGDEFIMRMLQLMMQLHNTQPGRLGDSKIKKELVNFGRLLLC